MVVGFIIIAGLIVYLIISLVVVFLGVRYARKKGIHGWKGGVLAAVVMYLLMFWDFIPFHIAHKYYCATEGGFTLNKTLEEWKAENPGVAETLVPIKKPEYDKQGNRERYILNQRFAWDIATTRKLLGMVISENRVVDTGTGEVLAQYVDFSSGQSSLEPEEFRDFKFWIYVNSCESGQKMPEKIKFNGFKGKIEDMGK
ncbi:MAG: hypothetical protein AB2653_14375 [Candidatus Thiodiazotropha endolucinida]